jgi:hypothetical protein
MTSLSFPEEVVLAGVLPVTRSTRTPTNGTSPISRSPAPPSASATAKPVVRDHSPREAPRRVRPATARATGWMKTGRRNTMPPAPNGWTESAAAPSTTSRNRPTTIERTAPSHQDARSTVRRGSTSANALTARSAIQREREGKTSIRGRLRNVMANPTATDERHRSRRDDARQIPGFPRKTSTTPRTTGIEQIASAIRAVRRPSLRSAPSEIRKAIGTPRAARTEPRMSRTGRSARGVCVVT